MTLQFEIGKTYFDRSICDYDCVFKFLVLARTAKQVTVSQTGWTGKVTKRGIQVRDGVEQFKPFGTYSMCAIVRADKEYV